MILIKNEAQMRSTQSKHWYRRYFTIMVVATLGLLLSFSAFFTVQRLEYQRLQTELKFHSEGYVNALQKEISIDFNALQSLKAFFKTSEVLSRHDFGTLTNDILQYNPDASSFQYLGWVPRVMRTQREEYERDARLDGYQNFRITEHGDNGEMIRAGVREEYFPVYFIEPYKGNEIALGYDLASDPVCKAALEKSCDTGKMIATARASLLREIDEQYGFLVFLPLYTKNTSADTIESREKNLVGFFLGVYRINSIVTDAFEFPKGLTIRLYDLSSPPNKSFLYVYSRQTSDLDHSKFQKEFELSHRLNVADRKWQLLCDFTSTYGGYHPMATSLGVLVSGLMLTFLLAVYLTANIKQTVQVEEMADRLSAEIAERKKAGEALQKSEEMYRLLFEGTTDGIIAFEIETKHCVYANPAAIKIFGYSGIELGQMSIADFHPKDSLEHVMSEFAAQVRGEKNTSSALPCLRKDGTIFYADITGANTVIDGKNCSVGFITDVSERHNAEASLKRNEAQLANACEMAHLGPWEYDVESDLFTFTDSFYAIFGTTAEKVGGYTMSSAEYAKRFILSQDVPAVALEARKAINTNDPNYSSQLGHRFLCVNGKIGYINIRFFVTKDSNGRTIKTTGVGQDITEHKRAEESLRESEKRYRELFENSTDFVYTLDLKGNFTNVNKAAEALTGYTKNELIGMNYNDYTPESTHAMIFETFNRVFAKAKPVKDFPLEVIIKDGTKRYFETCVSPLKKEEKIIGFQGNSRDITERRRTEEALHREKERFKLLVEESPLGVALINNEGAYQYINPKFSNIFGYTLEDIPTRQQWFKQAYPDERYRKHVISVLKQDQGKRSVGESRPRAFETTCKDGSEKTIRFRPVTMKSGDELLIYEDISDTQRLEKQLRQAQKMEAIGTLAGGIAHDFNNILTAILGFTQLATDDLDDRKALFEDLQEVRRAGNRAKDLVRQILAFSRQNEQKKTPVKVKLIAKEALKLIRSSLPATIEIRSKISSDALVMGDATQIHQVLMNLITNAEYAMRKTGGILEVDLTDVHLDSDFSARYRDIRPGNFLKLTVRDTGAGISSDILEKIFDPFFTTKDEGEGTGLGLSVVHGIIKSLDGAIVVYSEPAKGTEFNVYLPVIEREVTEEQDFEKPFPMGTERILFVDDEQPIRDMSKRLIESLGYRVEVRSNGIEALELFKASPESFDLIITDMTMPNMTGDQLAEQLMSIRPDIPVILCTGFSSRIDEKKSSEMGIRALALKPMVKNDIARIIRTVLDGGES